MTKAYQYLFYRLYRWASRWKWDNTPEVSAFVMLVALSGFNILVLAQLGSLLFDLSFLSGLSKRDHLIFLAGLGLLQYFLLLFHGRYKQIVKRFDPEPVAQARVRGTIVLVYVILSLTLPIVTAILHGIKLGTLDL
jgi:hypothetical protein